MSVLEKVQAIAREQMLGIANTINGELKAECPVQSGEAQASIHVEKTGDTSYRIGAANLHLFFADQGNNQSRAIIYPVKKKALKFTDGSLHGSARTYEGSHFVEKVADKYR